MTKRFEELLAEVCLPEDSYLAQDKEILDIFVEELQEIFAELNQLLPTWLIEPKNENLLKEIRRYFHTLKGSGRMVGANRAGALAWQVEDLLNRVIAKNLELTPKIQAFVLACKHVFEFKLYPTFADAAELSLDLRPLILLGEQLQQQEGEIAPELNKLLDELVELHANVETSLDHVYSDHANIQRDGFETFVLNDAPFAQPEQAIATTENDLSAETLAIYLEEGFEHLDSINHFLRQLEHTSKDTDALIRALHTLKGSSGMAHIEPLFQASANIEQALKVHLQESTDLTEAETQLLAEFSTYVTAYLAGLKHADHTKLSTATEAFAEIWDIYHQQQSHLSAENVSGTVTQILALEIDHLLDAEFEFEANVRAQKAGYLAQLITESRLLLAHTTHSSTRGMHVLAEKLSLAYQGLIQAPELVNDAYTYELFEQVHLQLIDGLDTLATGRTIYLSEKMQAVFERLVEWTHPALDVDFANTSSNAVSEPPVGVVESQSACQVALAKDLQSFELQQIETLADPELIEIFFDEAEDLIGGLTQTFTAYQQDPSQQQLLNALMRYLHTLKGGANMISAHYIGDIAHHLETIYEKLIHKQLQPSVAIFQVLSAVQDNLLSRLDIIRQHQQEYPAEHTLALLKALASIPIAESETVHAPALVHAEDNTAVQQNASNAVATSLMQQVLADQQFTATAANHLQDAELIAIFTDEAESLLTDIEQTFDHYQISHNTADLQHLLRHLHTLKGGANMLQANYIGQISHELESIYEKLIHGQLNIHPQLFETLGCIQDQLAERVEQIKQTGLDYPATQTLAVLAQLQALGGAVSPFDVPPKQDDVVLDHPVAELTNIEDESDDSIQGLIYQQFVEETQSLLQHMRVQIQQWFEQRSNRSLLLQLQRDAHTIKGAARMASQLEVAEIADILDDIFERFSVHQFSSNAYDGLLLGAIVSLGNAVASADTSGLSPLIAQLRLINFVDSNTFVDSAEDQRFATENRFELVEGDGTEPPSMHGEWQFSDVSEQSPEMIRISAGLVEKMIDLAGENAINRSRIEMDMSQFSTTLNEMELAIQRLSDQLRRMEGELESQIIAKHGNVQSRYSDFDPLEMDQYSSLNQLSKSLAESASDLIDFKVTLAEKVRDAESLLLQQSRIQSEMQDGLMRVRLVPFSRIATRLERLIRQISLTLNRPVNFEITNRDLELDRSILERLVAPLEHMLRNAIDHGIETPQERQAAQKTAVGAIEIIVSRQGSDVVVDIRDDGKGIDPRKIEQKAQQLGLISTEHQLSDQEILQFIFHSGFSTATSVTQISGRGVGLDVAQNDIKALGGHVTIHSNLGLGTHFNIRVPTTVSVSDALMVKVIDQQYAIPLAQIERIVRVSPTALNEYFSSGAEFFNLDGHAYKLRYAAEFVGTAISQPRFNQAGYSLPVLLIKGHNNQTVALLVDQLIGSRAQIVMKPLGKQLSRIDVIGGATILGDGQVCLIFDTANLARGIQAAGHRQNTQNDVVKSQRARQCIMIVDDSVTVRKVTSRLLERHGYDVVTAKDGVDAVEQIEHIKPDLMLLDIEMPRMDGFEVTNILRHHAVYHDLPIIMITSRTGEKHRERAFGLGVTGYMGKPFQETDLLAQIEQVLHKQGA